MTSLRIVVCPDSFKESMTATQAANAIEKGIQNVCKTCEVVKVPLADGGEGTAAILTERLGADVVEAEVTGPLGDRVVARYGLLNEKTAIMDVASVIGLELVPEEKRNPLHASSYGLGELIVHALDRGAEAFIIGLGGSATNDGGIGMMQALGAEIVNAKKEPVSFGGKGLHEIANMNIDSLDSRLKQCTFTIISDVDNVLIGPKGATYTYGRQKGADDAMLEQLERGMEHFAEVVKRDLEIDVAGHPSAGAAGGLGAAFIAFLRANVKSGIDYIIELTGLEKEIEQAAFVFTGEGKIDDQTLHGKTLSGVAALGKKHHVPVIAFVGANLVEQKAFYESGITAVFSILDKPLSLQESLANGARLLEKQVENVVRLLLSNGEK